jgi:hypothetical protein
VKEMIMGKIQDAFTSTDPQMVELRMQMFCQAGVLTQQGQATIQGQMVPGTSQPQRYLVDEIVEPTFYMLQVPWGRSRKKKVAKGVVQLPNPEARYLGRPILPEYAMMLVAWTHDHHEEAELDFPTEEGATTLSDALGLQVLWNKADIELQMLKPTSQPSQPSSSPSDGPSDDDDDDDGGDGNDNDGGLSSTPRSLCPDMSNPQGGTGGELGHQTPPPSQGKGQCPHALKNSTKEEGANPPT